MLLTRRHGRLLVTLILLAFLNSCTAYRLKELPRNEPIPAVGRHVVLHDPNGEQTHWRNVRIVSGILRAEIIEPEASPPPKPEARGSTAGFFDDQEGDFDHPTGSDSSPRVSTSRYDLHIYLAPGKTPETYLSDSGSELALPVAEIERVETWENDAGSAFLKTLGLVVLIVGVPAAIQGASMTM